ncbi:MAG TPA: hypothetical protein VN737_17635 [Bryobacteraceae bacterium]|jgi:hypothetical protein|nr:hypothetical protein [Bryobacteraceae bacterium]
MRRSLLLLALFAGLAPATEPGKKPDTAGAQEVGKVTPTPLAPNASLVTGIAGITRVYVEPLAGNDTAEAIRQLLIGSLQKTHLFVLTDNPDRADAVLRGAANDKDYTDAFDSQEGLNAHTNGGAYSGSSSSRSRSAGAYTGLSVGETESHHIRERKHEAYATVRLCNRDGDVLWATTQESHGAKFRGASEDVAEKIAHQLRLDYFKATQPPAKPQ